jgi:glutamate-1-semialdehyde 2,1-aminomutase
MGAIEDLYRARTPRSRELQQRAEQVMPGGETRASVYHAPYSVTIARGEGPHLVDVDGNRYVDLNNNYTCLVHGHAYPPVVAAAQAAVANGSTWSAKNVQQVELAEAIVERIPSVEQVRFANSGSEAVLVALSVARTLTRRRKVLMAKWAFHGQHEAFNDGHYRGRLEAWPDTYVADFGDAEAFEKVLDEHGGEVAAVFLEPVMAAAGLVGASPGFFARVAAATRRAGAVFVLDEATVQRVAVGGMQDLLGVRPDLTVLGKVCGGGFASGAIGGSREVMDVLHPARGEMATSGTFAGNPVALSAGLVALRDLTAERIAVMDAQVERLDAALAGSAGSHGLPYSSRRVGALLNVYLSDVPPPGNPVREDGRLMSLFHLAALANGVFIAPRGLMNVSTVTTDAVLDDALDGLDAAFAAVAAEA